jgi:hypothetical protein
MPDLFILCPVTAQPVKTGRSADRDAPAQGFGEVDPLQATPGITPPSGTEALVSQTLSPCPQCGRAHVWAGEDAFFEGGEVPLPTYREAVLEGQTVRVDGRRFIACDLRNCVLCYAGGEDFEFRHNHIEGCRWRLEGAAQRGLDFLRWVRHELGEEKGEAFAGKILDYINTPPPEVSPAPPGPA